MFRRPPHHGSADRRLPVAQHRGASIVGEQISAQAPDAALSPAPLGTYESGPIGESAAEESSYHAVSKRLLTVNAHAGAIDVIDAADPSNPVILFSVSPERTPQSTPSSSARTG